LETPSCMQADAIRRCHSTCLQMLALYTSSILAPEPIQIKQSVL
jgi:hypothetical protein